MVSIVLLTIGSIANDLTRVAGVREQLLNQLPPEDVPLTSAEIKTYAHRDPEQRYLVALGWLLDGIERAALRASQGHGARGTETRA